jgi:hypothetical protein
VALEWGLGGLLITYCYVLTGGCLKSAIKEDAGFGEKAELSHFPCGTELIANS